MLVRWYLQTHLLAVVRHRASGGQRLGSGRQVQHGARRDRRAGRHRFDRLRHRRHVRLQLRLRHQPGQGPGAKVFHGHCGLGLGGVHVSSLLSMCIHVTTPWFAPFYSSQAPSISNSPRWRLARSHNSPKYACSAGQDRQIWKTRCEFIAARYAVIVSDDNLARLVTFLQGV